MLDSGLVQEELEKWKEMVKNWYEDKKRELLKDIIIKFQRVQEWGKISDFIKNR